MLFMIMLGTWELADASSGNTAETLGLVGDATSTEFTLVTHGRIEGIARSPAFNSKSNVLFVGYKSRRIN